MATGINNLPYPGKAYSPFDILTAEELNEDVANIESLADGTGIGDGSVTTAKLDLTSFNPPYAVKEFSNATGNYTTGGLTSLQQIDPTKAKTSITLRSGKLVRVDLYMTGLWHANNSYAIEFDVGLGGAATTSTSGSKHAFAAMYGNNWSTDGSAKNAWSGSFFFTNTGTGAKDFYALWATTNAGFAGFIGQYAISTIVVTELL